MYTHRQIPGLLMAAAIVAAGCGGTDQTVTVNPQPAASALRPSPSATATTTPGVPAKPNEMDTSTRGGGDVWNSGEGRAVVIDALNWGQLVLDKSNRMGYVTGATYRGWRADLERIKKNFEFEFSSDNEWWLYDTGQIVFWLQWYSFRVGVDPVDRQLAWRVYTGGYPLYRTMWEQYFGRLEIDEADERPTPVVQPASMPKFKMGTYPINPLISVPRA